MRRSSNASAYTQWLDPLWRHLPGLRRLHGWRHALSALSELGVIYVLTHDSIRPRRDGPTHSRLRRSPRCDSIPNLLVIRPATAMKPVVLTKLAISNASAPPVVALSARPWANQANSSAAGGQRGLRPRDCDGTTELILIAFRHRTGSLCVRRPQQLSAEGRKCGWSRIPLGALSCFEGQDASYRDRCCRRRA